MSLKVESIDSQPQPKRALTLEIPLKIQSTSESSSSPIHTRPSFDFGVPTPTTTIETTQSELPLPALPISANASASCSSLPTLNVKFAPLPELLPRKRRSTVPLGMAARGQLMRRRQGFRERNAPPKWTDEGSEVHRRRQEELAARHALFNASAAAAAARKEEEDDEDDDWRRLSRRRGRKKGEGDELDDPLLVFGRMVKVAGRTLWGRVSSKDVTTAVAAATSAPKAKEGSNEQGDARTPTKTPTSPIRPIFENITSNLGNSHVEKHGEEEEERGRVWEEEIGNSFPCNVGQTQTIIEGRAIYSCLTGKVEVSNKSPPSSPTVLSSRRMSGFMSTKKISSV